MNHKESIIRKVQKELKYLRVQNIRLHQEVDQLSRTVQHNRRRHSDIEDDRMESEYIVNYLREIIKNDRS